MERQELHLLPRHELSVNQTFQGTAYDPAAVKFTRKSARKNGAARKTLYEEKIVLKAIFKEAIKSSLITRNPWDEVAVNPPKKDEALAKRHAPDRAGMQGPYRSGIWSMEDKAGQAFCSITPMRNALFEQ